MDTQTLINADSEIYDFLHKHLQEFLIKWPQFIETVVLDFDGIQQVYRNDIFIVQLSGQDIRNNTRVKIRLHAIKNSEYHEDIFSSFRVDVSPDSIALFNTNKLNPEELYNSFYAMAARVVGLVDDRTHDIEFSFDRQCEIEEVLIMVNNIDSNRATKEVAHRLYDINDIDFLSRKNIDIACLQKLSDFYYLWQNTKIRYIIAADDFKQAFELYVTDVERYHTLLKMERI